MQEGLSKGPKVVTKKDQRVGLVSPPLWMWALIMLLASNTAWCEDRSRGPDDMVGDQMAPLGGYGAMGLAFEANGWILAQTTR